MSTKNGKTNPSSAKQTPGLVTDARFKHVHHDPRFKPLPKQATTVAVDDRFAAVIDDDDFNSLTVVDKFGRKVAVKGHTLSKQFVKASELERKKQEDEAAAAAAAAKDKISKPAKSAQSKPEAADKKQAATAKVAAPTAVKKAITKPLASQQQQQQLAKKKPTVEESAEEEDSGDESPLPVGYANFRGSARANESDEESSTSIGSTGDEIEVDSSTEAEDEEDDDGYYTVDADGVRRAKLPGSIAGDLADITEDPTSRLAIVNMEWSQIRAVDLLAILRSFVPPGGEVKRVTVYPSKFGLERMAYESRYGPMFSLTDSKNRDKTLGVPTTQNRALDDEIRATFGEEDEDMEEDLQWEVLDEDEDLDIEEDLNEDVDLEEDEGEIEEEDETPTPRHKQDQQKGKQDQKKKKKKSKSQDPRDDIKNIFDEVEYNYRLDHADENKDEQTDYVDVEALRKYELEKLKYYYAIAECDSPQTALHIYKEADNLEFEKSSILLDLRFVPDEEKFDDSIARETATRVPANYRAPEFYANALQQTRVKCTWDQEDPRRAKLLRQNFTKADFEMEDLEMFLASEDSDAGFATDVPVTDPDATTDEFDSHSDEASADDSAAEDSDAERRKKAKLLVSAPRVNGKTMLKRRARNRFASILAELRTTPLGSKKPESESSDDDSEEEADKKSKKLKKPVEQEEESLSDVEITFEPALVSASKKGKVKDPDALVQSDEEWDKSDPFFQHSDSEVDDEEVEFSKGKNVKSAKDGKKDDKTLAKPAEKDKKSKSKKGKHDEDDDEARKSKAELELLMINSDDEDDPSKREKHGYHLKQLLKERKQAKKEEMRRQRRQTEALSEDAVIEAALASKRKEPLSSKYSSSQQQQQREDADGMKTKRVRTIDGEAAKRDTEFKMDVGDNRFSAIHEDPDFAIDPTSAAFKATEGTELLLQESARIRREKQKQQEQMLRERKEKARSNLEAKKANASRDPLAATSSSSTTKAELSSMVATLKARAALQSLARKQ